MPSDTITSTLLYVYSNRFGVTREGAVLAAEPCCTDFRRAALAVLVLVTDDGLGGTEAINALGFALEPGPIDPSHVAICNALLQGKYATAVLEAERLGILK